jgi:hypothetical protein
MRPLLLLLPIAAALLPPALGRGDPLQLPAPGGRAPKAQAKTELVTIPMKPARASRMSGLTVTTDREGRPQIHMPHPVPLPMRGEITVDGEQFSIYLPQLRSYPLRNHGTDDGRLSNTSTLLSIDGNRDGKLTEDEGWFANLPVRIGDRMFDVKRIAADGSAIDLAPSKSPLRGVVVGRRCPPFAYHAQDGSVVKNEDFNLDYSRE